MKTALIKIGNSRGIRIPKEFLEQCQLYETVELELCADHLIIRAATPPRNGWEDAFRDMRENGDDTLLDEVSHSVTKWDDTEWEWQ